MSVLNYAISLDKGALIVFVADLKDDKAPFARYTDAGLWQLIADSWISEGGTPESLRHLAIWQVTNAASQRVMLNEFSSTNTPEGRLKILPAARPSAFNDAPFLMSGMRVVREMDRLSTHSIQMKEATLVKMAHGHGSGDDEFTYHHGA